jgi:integrase
MATGKITNSSVAGVQPGARDQFLWDKELRGFGLKVTPAGNRVYLIQYRLNGRAGKTRRVTIGNHGSPWTPSKAREEAERLLIAVRQGVDVAEQKKDRKRVATELGFRGYAKGFVTDYLKEHWPSSWRDAESALNRFAVPVLGDKPLPSITRGDLQSVLAQAKGKVAARRYLYAVLSRLFKWAISQGDLDRHSNPLADMEPPPAAESRDRTLEDWELRLAWQASQEVAKPYGPIVRLLALLGQRRDEVGEMDWNELKRAAREWNIPGARTKNGLPHTVPLPALAVAEFDKLAGGEKWPKRGLVFASSADTAPSGYSKAKKKLDAQMLTLARKEAAAAGDNAAEVKLAPWRLHDLRRTASTGMQRLGIRFEVNEAVLNHRSGAKSGVAGVYQRHEWKDEKRAALEAWAAHIGQVLSGADQSNVVQLAAARA